METGKVDNGGYDAQDGRGGYERGDRGDHKKWRNNDSNFGKYNNKRDYGSDRRNRGHRGRYYQGGHQPRRGGGGFRVNAEALSMESALAREDKPIVFDLSSGREKLELNDWFKQFPPSKVRRSDGIGYIMVLSKTISEDEKRDLFEANGNNMAVSEEWRQLTEESDAEVTFETIKELATKHKVLGGKWILHLHGPNIDETWKFVVLQLAYEKMPKGVIGVRISPVNDVSIPGGSAMSGDDHHMISIMHRDMSDEQEIFSIEASLRTIPIRSDLTYKPNVFSLLGIYRNNKYKLRPTIYVSEKQRDGEFKVEKVVDPNWSYSRIMVDINNNDGKSSLHDLEVTLASLLRAVAEVEGAIKRIDLLAIHDSIAPANKCVVGVDLQTNKAAKIAETSEKQEGNVKDAAKPQAVLSGEDSLPIKSAEDEPHDASEAQAVLDGEKKEKNLADSLPLEEAREQAPKDEAKVTDDLDKSDKEATKKADRAAKKKANKKAAEKTEGQESTVEVIKTSEEN